MATKRLYRSRKGQIFGVCQGIADWRDLPVDTLRFIVVIAILVTGLVPGLIIYALLGLLLPLEPGYGTNYSGGDGYDAERQRRERKQEGERSYGSSREDLRNSFESLKRKVEGMEEQIFDKERDWDHRFHEDEK